jgi:2,3-bisphosphoglycerate-independent phosphoglycerate mutase
MINPKTKEIDTEHSINPVPLLLVNEKIRLSKPQSSINAANGILADIAPTVLSILNLPQPEEMTGYNLLNSLAPQYQVMYNQKTPIY